MPYVGRPAEVARFHSLVTNLQWEGVSLAAHFETDAEFIRSVLPPCFSMPKSPRAMVKVGTFRSTASGVLETAFDVAGIYVRARFGDIEGWYHLTLIMTGDMPVTLGRELWGEAKKRGTVQWSFDRDEVSGSASRDGDPLIELSGVMTTSAPSPDAVDYSLNLKVPLNYSGRPLGPNAYVLVAEVHTEVCENRLGNGQVQLRSGPSDPCGEVPLGPVDQFVMQRASARYRYSEHLAPEADYLPYLIGRSFDAAPQRP